MERSSVGPVEVATRLGLGRDHRDWLAGLAVAGPPPDPTPRWSERDAVAGLRELGLTQEDAQEAAAFAPRPEHEPELWWLLERCRHALARGMGEPGPVWIWPALPARLGTRGRWFYVHVFLAAAPALRRWSAARGVPDDVVRATLLDLGEKVALHRVTHAVGGLDKQDWFTLHFRGAIHRLGALQFERVALGRGTVPGVEGAAIGLHIPQAGPITVEACDESVRRARSFFPAYFPEWPCQRAVCVSWLLDPQLGEYLGPDTNIIRFQRRFRLAPPGEGGHPGDRSIVEFVFRRIDPSLDELPRRTTLERAVADHLRAGRHWRMHPGWFPIG